MNVPIKKVDPVETHKEIKNIWRKKDKAEDKGESIPSSGANVSFGN